MPLSEDAKTELKNAIRIVREDKFEAYARGALSGFAPKPPTSTPPADPNVPPGPPPKPDDGPPADPPKVKKGGYWGELLDD
jgi:hypothetical protein